MKESETIRINKLVYKFDETALNRDFDLIHVLIKDHNSLSSFDNVINKMNFLSITHIKKLEYVLLFKKGEFKALQKFKNFIFTKVRFGYFDKNVRVYQNNIMQLFLNQLASDDNLLPERNNSIYLFIHKATWNRTLKNGNKQIYALKIAVKYKNMLTANVVTFTQSVDLKNSKLFYLNKGRGVIESVYQNKSTELYKKGNFDKKNSIDFMSLVDCNEFERSKVGIINSLLDNLHEYFGQYFNQGPFLKDVALLQGFTKPQSKEKNVWNCLKNTKINLFFDKNNKVVKELATQFILGYKNSEILNSNNIGVTENNHSVTGLNIQIIRDTRKDETVPEEYELGIREKIIQHISPDGFGKMNYKEQSVKWGANNKEKDIANDPAVINVFQNLVVKRDLINRQMSLVDTDLMDLISEYQFFFFDNFIDDKVIVVRLKISKNGKMQFTSEQVNSSKIDSNSELAKVYSYVLERAKQEYLFWNQIECVVKVKSDYILIVQTEMQILPLQEEVAKRERNADVNQRIEKSKAIKDLKFLVEQLDHNKKYTSNDLQLMIANIDELNGPLITVGEVNRRFKEDKQVTFRSSRFREICNDLENTFGYTYNCSVRQSKPKSLFPGFKGMGLIKEDNNFYYYVGNETNLKLKINRAIRLKKMIILTGNDDVVTSTFEDLVPLMAVKFVRNGRFTVLPFPIKYLREFSEYQRRLSKMNQDNED